MKNIKIAVFVVCEYKLLFVSEGLMKDEFMEYTGMRTSGVGV
jgi:hypothetical protein